MQSDTKIASRGDFADLIVPLATFSDLDTIDKSNFPLPKDAGPVAMFQVLQECVRELLDFQVPSDAPFTQYEWDMACERCLAGLIKDTVEYGTTSVSMGVAEEYYVAADEVGRSTTILVIANNGTGGTKVGIYAYGKNGT